MEILFFKQLIENNRIFSVEWLLTDESGTEIDSGKAVSQLGNFTYEFIRFLLSVNRCDLFVSYQMKETLKALKKEMDLRGLKTERKDVPKYDLAEYIHDRYTFTVYTIKDRFFEHQLNKKEVA